MFKIPKHKVFLYLHDLAILVITGFIAFFFDKYYQSRYMYSPDGSGDHFLGDIIIALTIFVFFSLNKLYLYQVVLNYARHLVALIKAVYQSFIAFIFITYFLKIIDPFSSRLLLIMVFVTMFFLFLVSRVFLVPTVYFWLINRGFVKRNMLIVGAGEMAQKRANIIKTNKRSYFNVVGYLDNDKEKIGNVYEGVKVLGNINEMKEFIKPYNVKDILIAINNISAYDLQCIIDFCKKSKRTIHVSSELYNIITDKLEIEEIGGITAFRIKPATRSFYDVIKRVIDVSGALLIILGLLPVWLILIALVKFTSAGPIFYKAKVIGKDENAFMMYKFRSMYYKASTKLHEDKVKKMIAGEETTKKLRNDPRITPLGRFLRKYSIDEFPQLINVLRGEMSLVGPRPNVPYEYELMNKWQKRRFSIKPGMTGIWQIKGRDEVSFTDQIALDIYYIENRSLKLDLEILLKTIPVVVLGKGGA